MLFSRLVKLQFANASLGIFYFGGFNIPLGMLLSLPSWSVAGISQTPESLHKTMVDPREFAQTIKFKSWASLFRMFTTAEKRGVSINLVATVTPTVELPYLPKPCTVYSFSVHMLYTPDSHGYLRQLLAPMISHSVKQHHVTFIPMNKNVLFLH